MLTSSRTFFSVTSLSLSKMTCLGSVSSRRCISSSARRFPSWRLRTPLIYTHRTFSTVTEANEGMIIRGRGDMSMEPIPMPGAPQPGECLIRVKNVGICGSDVHFFANGSVGSYAVTSPMVIGHEGAGVVEQVGEGVTDLKVGDRVALEPAVPCGHCELCRSGEYNLCPEIKCFGTPPNNGCLTRYVRHPASFCFKLPENVSLEEGVMCEPLAVATYACKDRAEVKDGDKVLVFGDGPIGTMAAMVSSALKAGRVLVCGHHDDKLQEIVEACPQAEVLNVKGSGDYNQVAEKIRDALGGPADCSVDTTGAQDAVSSCIRATQSGGRVAMVGIGAVEMKLPVVDALLRQVDIRGTFRFCNTYPTCIDMISSGKVDVKQLITHRYHFNNAEILQAFEDCRAGVGRDGRPTSKCMININ
ncbi:Sorbitol dehydrogenase, putative [Perkinsus marinus ATCC 50983]|uniref:Sorbitol dehydrogenase, putative n=1 Tax=Perkinsus marinus (strain ATCC 50983 / TXsc) TaxID=423536 RepID=C5LLR2_PERM5|nr:Sorbitol dehydrogenase, putative [Perkinsus marinus ATCC 50983]EER02284.1 Sorbitol dehydrogenase, putative [Perkinsus marinus ATCC 50983]|eukprot:XP_002769566.1 Sorbitol dehydrogenase, putative [Perkinsus marinus ATCC 50983]